MLVAVYCFTVMNVLIKEASAKFALGSGELVFGACCFQPLRSVLPPYYDATPSARPIGKPLKPQYGRDGAMLLLFYAVTHLPLTTGVTLSYTSSIFGGIFLPDFERTDFRLHAGGAAPWFCLGVVLLLNPSFRSGQEPAALAGLAGGAMSGWAYLKVRELSLAGEPGWRVVFTFPQPAWRCRRFGRR